MERAGRSRGARRARLESRRRQRQGRYGRFLGLTFLGALLPGAGLIAAGKRGVGGFLLFLFLMGLAMVGAVALLVPPERLLSYGGDRQMLLTIGGGLAAVALIWLIVALVTHRALEPAGLRAGKRLGGAAVAIVATSLVVAPLSIAANNALTQRDLIGALSGGRSHTTPNIVDVDNPWDGMEQLNILLLGSDAGDGREGVRPDTLMVASVDIGSGDTTLISIPRNLQRFPFPPDSPLAERYPDGFTGPGEPTEWMINAVFRNVPAQHPDVFETVDNPGADATKWAVEGALGIDLDYFVMVNLEGFEAIVDAIGGVTLNVPRDIPVGNRQLPGGQGCTEPRDYIPAGDDEHLDGGQALWFARSRCGSDDYDRMARQQCVIDAIVKELDPTTLMVQYQSLASAARELFQTDVPEDMFRPLIELAVDVQKGELESLSLDRAFFDSMGTTSANPDYAEVHTRIAEILDRSGSSDDAEDTDETDTEQADAEDVSPAEPTEESSAEDTAASAADDGTTGAAEGSDGDDTSGGTDSEPDEDVEPEPDQPVQTDRVC